MLNRLEAFADEVGRVLASGERPLAMRGAVYLAGFEDLGQPKPTLGAETLEDMLWQLPTPYFMDLADRAVAGTSLIGWPGCDAQQLSAALASTGDLLVTDRRVVVLEIPAGASPQVTVRWARELSGIAGLHRAWRFAQAGRTWFFLADGSAVAIAIGLFTTGAAKDVVAAWETGKSHR